MEHYFEAQEQRPPHLGEVDVTRLSAVQRALLANDGSVVRLVEALWLDPVVVEVLDERPASPTDELWPLLEPPLGDLAARRRIVVRSRRYSTPRLFAESILVPSRLPVGFLALATKQQHGIGSAMAEARLETRRELLWFGWASPPVWMGELQDDRVLSRTYRVAVRGVPAMAVAENFPEDRSMRNSIPGLPR